MATLKDIRRSSDIEPVIFVDYSTPTGTFGAVTRVLGLTMTYLFHGVEGDDDAPVIGRIEDGGNGRAYRGSTLKGGYLLPEGDSKTVFAEMANGHKQRSSRG